jgi:predicted amidohydrolase
MMAKYRKIHLYDVDIPGGITIRESDVIRPGSKPTVIHFREQPSSIIAPYNLLITPLLAAFGTIAVAICFDIRFQYLIAALRESNPEICAYLLPSAFNTTTGPKAWEVVQRARAIDNQIYVGMCSPARQDGDEVGFYL